MRVKDWLLDLAENNYIDWIDGEISIIPIKEEDDDDK